MSTLTKILIVLLTLSSIFFCGIVVTYVGNAANYKKAYDERRSTISSLTATNEDFTAQINNLKDQMSNNKITHDSAMEKLQKELDDKGVELENYKRDLKDAAARLENNNAILLDNAKTVEMNNQLRKNAENKIAELEALKTNNLNQIKELTDAIFAKDALIDQHSTEIKRLIEENTRLQNILDGNLQLTSQRIIAPAPVTEPQDFAKITPPMTTLGLEGVITEVKLQDSLASISIGSADGVREQMKFHVIRNNKFVCDLVILNVNADQASGYLELVSDTAPRAGDIVKTNF
ncbi:MAG: hypothetical protein JW787_08275 [Sedimentisphaerales bacterium]|nr:hypothetical protein [Sedimentisphaerales bacterium]